jgi:hypothetical protein
MTGQQDRAVRMNDQADVELSLHALHRCVRSRGDHWLVELRRDRLLPLLDDGEYKPL